MRVVFKTIDSDGGEHSESILLGITHTKLSDPVTEFISGRSYTKKIMFIGHPSHWPYLGYYKNYLKENVAGKSSIIIRYFDEAGKASAQLIMDYAGTINPAASITIQKESRPRGIEADPAYYPNIISILISRH
jgi:hypothetical protein